MAARRSELAAHTHHAAASTGSACRACHMPAIAETFGDVKSAATRFVSFWLEQLETLNNFRRVQTPSHGEDDPLGRVCAPELEIYRPPWRSQ